MTKLLVFLCLLGVLVTGGCSSRASSSGASSVKQLNESTAKQMVADYLNSTNPSLGLLVGPLVRFATAAHTASNYNTLTIGSYGFLMKRLIGQGFVSQQVETISVPEVSGTFVRGCGEGPCNLGWFKQELILRLVPGTNELQGEYIFQSSIGTFRPKQVSGAIEPDGTFKLYGGADSGPGQYYEEGGKGYLKFPHYTYGSVQRNYSGVSVPFVVPYAGPAAGRKVTATLYSYALTPKFKALMKQGPGGPYVDVGKFVVGNVTTLRLDTDTQASADFACTVSLNSTGRLIYPAGTILKATGQVVFGKKPDQSWAINSVTGVSRFRKIW